MKINYFMLCLLVNRFSVGKKDIHKYQCKSLERVIPLTVSMTWKVVLIVQKLENDRPK